MSSSKKIDVVVEIPDIDNLPDDQLTEIAHMRDGRWSEQTKNLLAKFKTEKLDLNRGWASTWTGWTCPCCRREKPQIARVSSGGVLLCRLEFHHDHIADIAKQIYRRGNPRSEDQSTNIQVSRAEDWLMPFVERFEKTLICIDCNLADGKAKLELGKEIDKHFTFSPSEITTFITTTANGDVPVNVEKGGAALLALSR